MPTEKGSNTNHPGIVDFKGHSYFFYHNDALPGGHSYCRSVCVEEFVYGSDGTIPELYMTRELGQLCGFCERESSRYFEERRARLPKCGKDL